MHKNKDADLIKGLRLLCEEAGREIMQVYRKESTAVTAKVDDSPVTQADIRANDIIMNGLMRLTHEPLVSEEGESALHADSHRGPEAFWLIDPLDGTRDFIGRLDTFVVCIARVEENYPVLGMIHAPVTGETWWAEKGVGAFGSQGEQLMRTDLRTPLIAAGSRSMASDQMKLFCKTLGISEVQRYGSALKFCKLVEGSVDLYPRFGPTSEWDTAAGQIIAEEAGCTVVDISSGTRLKYGKPFYKNSGGFLASRGDLDLMSPLVQAGIIPRPKV